MRKRIRTIFLNIVTFLLVFLCAGVLADFCYSKFLPEGESEGIVNWSCKNHSASLIGGFEPNCKGRWIKKNGAESFDTDFSTDAFGRRTVFDKIKKSASDSGLVLFFGGSDVLGKGVNDHETIANQFFNLSDFAQVKNFGGPGFGPQQALELLQFSDLKKEAPADPVRNIGLFFYHPVHVDRAAGSWPIATEWGAHFPYYVLDSDDQLVFKGNFTSGGRYSHLQLMAKKSVLLNALILEAGNYFPFSDADFRLTAKILVAIKTTFSAKYQNAQFYVVIGPTGAKSSSKMKNLLNEFGVKYLDYSKVWDPENPASRAAEGHPSPLVYRLVAEQLAKDLKR